MEIITNNPLKLSDKLLKVSFKDVNVTLDLVTIFKNAKLSNSSNDLYIDVKNIFKSKYCRFNDLNKWTRNEYTQKYLNIMNNRFLNNAKSVVIKNIEKRHSKKY